MTKDEIALQLTLAALEKIPPAADDRSPETVGKTVADTYNSIYTKLKDRHDIQQ